ncbi:MAG: glycosyltransferase family 2 protein [Deltaproteobacteria bacterium]|nr:glycosyltransferase family 2 protein [Deltaproteobacteria bacterium]
MSRQVSDTGKILAVIPAYNEEASISGVVASIQSEDPHIDILVVNDGSKDRTGEIARSIPGVHVIDLPCNLGIGGAVQAGFKYAGRENYEIAFQFDGDGQHLASEIPRLLDPIRSDSADVVIGSRFSGHSTGYRSTLARRMGIGIFSLVNSMIVGRRITDNTSGFRAYNREAIVFLAKNYPMDYPEPEAVIILGRNGFRIVEAPVAMRDRMGGRSSINGLRSLYYMVKVLLAIGVNVIRPKLKRRGNSADDQR